MARRLNALFGAAGPQGWRGVGFVGLILAVVAVHGCVTDEVAAQLKALDAAAAMPPRMTVAYVRELEPAAPPATPTTRAPPPPRPARKRSTRAVAASTEAPASEPEATPEAPAASEPPPAVAVAASAPEAEASAAIVLAADASAASRPEASATEPVTAAASSPEAVAAAASAPDDAASAPFIAAGVEWPASTRVSYTLDGNYRGQVQGDAQVEWIRVGTHYQVHLDLTIGPSFAPLVTRRMSSDGQIGADGLLPRRFDQATKLAFGDPRRVTMTMDDETVVLANGNRRDSPPGVQDAASQFIQMTYLFTARPDLLQVGRTIEMPLALPLRVDRWTYEVRDEDTVYTSFGALPVFHVKPRTSGLKPGDLVAEIWFAPALKNLPVRIRIQQDATSNFIDLLISRRPEMAAR